jgi:hypothetical protein
VPRSVRLPPRTADPANPVPRNSEIIVSPRFSSPVCQSGARTPRRGDVLEWKGRWENLNGINITSSGGLCTGGYLILQFYLFTFYILPFTFRFSFSVPAWVHAYLACTCTYAGYRGQRHVRNMQLGEGIRMVRIAVNTLVFVFNSAICWLQCHST